MLVEVVKQYLISEDDLPEDVISEILAENGDLSERDVFSDLFSRMTPEELGLSANYEETFVY